MSSARKRRYANRLQNQRTAEQQIAMMQSWNASLLRIAALAMVYPQYDPQRLLTYREGA